MRYRGVMTLRRAVVGWWWGDGGIRAALTLPSLAWQLKSWREPLASARVAVTDREDDDPLVTIFIQ